MNKSVGTEDAVWTAFSLSVEMSMRQASAFLKGYVNMLALGARALFFPYLNYLNLAFTDIFLKNMITLFRTPSIPFAIRPIFTIHSEEDSIPRCCSFRYT